MLEPAIVNVFVLFVEVVSPTLQVISPQVVDTSFPFLNTEKVKVAVPELFLTSLVSLVKETVTGSFSIT